MGGRSESESGTSAQLTKAGHYIFPGITTYTQWIKRYALLGLVERLSPYNDAAQYWEHQTKVR